MSDHVYSSWPSRFCELSLLLGGLINFIFGNDHEEGVLKIRTYRRVENSYLLHDAL